MLDNNFPDRVVFFDGHCVVCNKLVDFLLDKDSLELFKFASLQSEIAEVTLLSYSYPRQSKKILDNGVYIRFGKLKIKSDAILSMAIDIGGIYKVSAVFYVIPKWIRDRVYDAFARRRYGWFGQNDFCRITTSTEMTRFLE